MILVKEDKESFEVDVAVEQKGDGLLPPVSLENFLADTNHQEVHYDVLKNLTLMAEHLPGLKTIIQTSGPFA